MPTLTAVLGLAISSVCSAEARAVTGAELGRNTPYRHGLFEARLMFAAGDGIVSSLFLWKPGSELDGAYWNEIDIEKVGSDCRGYSSNAIHGDPELQSTQRIVAASDLCSEYHTHAIEWTPEHLIWLLDGVEVRRLDPAELAAFEQNAPEGLQIRFNLWVGNASFGGTFSNQSLPAHEYIDWVAYSRYTPGAGPGGSDFSAAWREDFDAPLGSDWSYGTWVSPLGNSVHSPRNVSVASGIGVLSLTEDDATGYAGTPPGASADAGALDFDGIGGAAGAAGEMPSGGSGDAGATAGAVTHRQTRASGGCGLARRHEGAGVEWLASVFVLVLGASRVRASASPRGSGRGRGRARPGRPRVQKSGTPVGIWLKKP